MATFICPLCLIASLNSQILAEAGKHGKGNFAYIKVVDNNMMCKIAAKEISRRVSEGGTYLCTTSQP
jgi:hypothetical protein